MLFSQQAGYATPECAIDRGSVLVARGDKRRLVRNAFAFAADIRKKPSVRDEDGPTASTTMWTVMLARETAGRSGMTLNVTQCRDRLFRSACASVE
jgi:hypothetical protein